MITNLCFVRDAKLLGICSPKNQKKHQMHRPRKEIPKHIAQKWQHKKITTKTRGRQYVMHNIIKYYCHLKRSHKNQLKEMIIKDTELECSYQMVSYKSKQDKSPELNLSNFPMLSIITMRNRFASVQREMGEPSHTLLIKGKFHNPFDLAILER